MGQVFTLYMRFHSHFKHHDISLESVHAIAYIATMIISLSILAYEKVVQHPGF